jgi:hypothetical protein
MFQLPGGRRWVVAGATCVRRKVILVVMDVVASRETTMSSPPSESEARGRGDRGILPRLHRRRHGVWRQPAGPTGHRLGPHGHGLRRWARLRRPLQTRCDHVALVRGRIGIGGQSSGAWGGMSEDERGRATPGPIPVHGVRQRSRGLAGQAPSASILGVGFNCEPDRADELVGVAGLCASGFSQT